jgi:hypothetical protein
LIEVDFNPLTGRRSFVDVDAVTGDTIITDQYSRDVTQKTFDRNHDIADLHQGHKGETMRLAASIPPEVHLDMLDRYGVDIFNADHREAAMKLLNSNEYYKTRVWGGRL